MIFSIHSDHCLLFCSQESWCSPASLAALQTSSQLQYKDFLRDESEPEQDWTAYIDPMSVLKTKNLKIPLSLSAAEVL